MIRILQYTRVLDRGGIEKFIFNHYKYMNHNKYHYDFLLERNQMEAYEDELKMYSCGKYYININNQYNLSEVYYRFYSFFKRNLSKFDIVHFEAVGPNAYSAAVLLAAKNAGIKHRIVHSHMAMNWAELSKCRKMKIILFRQVISQLGTDYLACGREAAEFAFTKKRISCGVSIIHNALNTDEFMFNETARHKIREELGIKNKFVIGNVGRILKRKNHLFMVDVFKEILKIQPNAILVIVGEHISGEESYYENIKLKIKQEKMEEKVIFTGNRKDIPDLLSSFDVFIFPSTNEGMGVVGIEAQASGLKVIASELIPSEMDITGNVIWMPKKANINEWAEAVVRCNDNYIRRSMALEINKAGYNVRFNAAKLEGIYQKNYEAKCK